MVASPRGAGFECAAFDRWVDELTFPTEGCCSLGRDLEDFQDALAARGYALTRLEQLPDA